MRSRRDTKHRASKLLKLHRIEPQELCPCCGKARYHIHRRDWFDNPTQFKCRNCGEVWDAPRPKKETS